MAKGFAPVFKPEQEELLTKRLQLTPINEIQANLLSCVDQIQDPRTTLSSFFQG